eukprot:TRINITY_DN11664_c0_g1_i1.p1 TRINITY_DN11664_c0_g1~~TRINITY_DN11664_c0_g1_i1.p1  ORF type:complete len:818 (+),score=160.29 TRINITY_DN11664_c0_g1_i1:215-2668(+)
MFETHQRGGTVASVLPLLTTDKHQQVGITPLLREYIANLCEHEQTWLKFPLQETLKRKSDSRRRRPTTSILIAKTSQSNTSDDISTDLPAPESAAVPRRYRSKSESAASLKASIDQLREEAPQPEEPKHTTSSLLSWFKFFQKEEPPAEEKKKVAFEESKLEIEQQKAQEPEKQATKAASADDASSAKTPNASEEGIDGEEEFNMTKKQKQHAFMILNEVPQLNDLRRRLVPKKMSEEDFWRVYFFLVGNKLGNTLEEDYDEEIKYNYNKPRRNPTDPSLKHISPYVQLFQGKAKVEFKGAPTMEVSSYFPWWRTHAKGFRDFDRYMTSKTDDVIQLEMRRNEERGWDMLDIYKLKLENPKQIRILFREGIPELHRRIAWTHAIGAREFFQQQPTYYQNTLKEVFGDAAPAVCNPIPTFGGPMTYRAQHYLSEAGIEALKRLLVMVAMTNDLIEYAPMLADLLCFLLSFLPEDEAFVTCQIMIAHSEKQCRFLWLSKRDLTVTATCLSSLISTLLPELNQAMIKCEVRIVELGEELLSSYFLPFLPYQTVLRIFDAYTLEGSVILLRISLGILLLCSEALIQCESRAVFLATLHEKMQELHDADNLIFTSLNRFKLKHSEMIEMFKTFRDDVPEAQLAIPTVQYIPLVPSNTSRIITPEQFEMLWYWLPQRMHIEEPVLIFTTAEDGYNLNTLISKCSDWAPQIMIFKTHTHCIFGAYITDPWPARSTESFFGSGESFLFTLYPRERKYGWRLGNKSFFLLRQEHALVVGGGGGFGLWIDSEFNMGRSEPCETFENDPLHPTSSDFRCVHLEVFSIK